MTQTTRFMPYAPRNERELEEAIENGGVVYIDMPEGSRDMQQRWARHLNSKRMADGNIEDTLALQRRDIGRSGSHSGNQEIIALKLIRADNSYKPGGGLILSSSQTKLWISPQNSNYDTLKSYLEEAGLWMEAS